MRLELTGALDGKEVARYYHQLNRQLVVGGGLELSLAGVTGVDSTSVALLVSLARLARAKQCRLSIKSIPASLRRLIVVARLSELLPIVDG